MNVAVQHAKTKYSDNALSSIIVTLEYGSSDDNVCEFYYSIYECTV